jgi:hypothetical protein
MAAYENSPGFVGQNFQTEYSSRKLSKPAVQKSIAKASSVPKARIARADINGCYLEAAIRT